MLRLLTLFLGLFFVASCNGLFYHPDNVVYTDPGIVDQPYDNFTVKGRDGEMLSGWYLPTPWPRHGLIVHFHGNAQNMTAHILFTFWLLDAGYDLVVFDYRGYGASSGSPTRTGMVKDSLDVLEHVSQTYYQPGDDFFVLAQSLGGAIAIPTLAFWEGDPKPDALVLDSTFASYRDIAQDKLSSFWLTWPLQWPLSLLVTDDLSPIDYANGLNLPILMIQGTADHVTPYAEAERLHDVFPSTDKNLWVVPGGRHTSSLYEGSPYQKRLLRYFCKRSNKPELCETNRRLFVKRYEQRKAKAVAKQPTNNKNSQ